jgi:NAD(P)-dependent dehydrogenase (short-subunit alcohol dehydrogenase family)
MLDQNKVAIITGAKQGIGFGIAKILAKSGFNIVISDINQVDSDNSADQIKFDGIKVVGIACDVSNKEQVDSLINQTLEKFGRLDVLVNNAGVYPFKTFQDLKVEDWERVMDINLKGVFLTSKAASKVLPAGGRIINISSIASIIGFQGLSHYCASKAGVNGFTRALALELAPKNITVNTVLPGAIATPGAQMSEDIQQQTISNIPLQRIGTPDDIANMVEFLASDKSSYITGQEFIVDGGWTLK